VQRLASPIATGFELKNVSVSVPLRLRPLEIGDLLDETFRMYRRHFLLFAGISAILSIPSAASSGVNYLSLFGSLFEPSTTAEPDTTALLAGQLAQFVAIGINVALLPFGYGAVIYAACESALGRPVTAGGIFRAVLRRYFPLLGFFLLIAVMALVFCLIPLWAWIWINWVAVVPMMFVENIGLGGAMSRSWHLVAGRWWRTFLIVFLMFILTTVVRWALVAFAVVPFAVLSLVLSNYILLALSGAVTVVVDALVNPVFQIALVLIYFDLRVRREALDLFQMAHQLSASPATP
jgi:hypothetical protein